MTPPVVAAPQVHPHPTFDKHAYHRFKLPLKFGEAISGWDDPDTVPASEASHMREDDYVVGLVLHGRARAYPLWIVDYYHVVNDRIDGERFFLTSCERCQSGSAFLTSTVAGNPEREPLFRSVGFQNATLLLKDLRSGSHWIHYDGRGLDRKAAGVELPWIPTYHMEWGDWVRMHPDTDVMLAPDNPEHPDARHGHGREEMFARAGMDPGFIPTVLGDLDDSYPENEMVLGLAGGPDDVTPWVAYPLREVQREGGVVTDVLGGTRVAVLAGPGPDGITMAAFAAAAGGRDLTLVRQDGRFRDVETGSVWTIEGTAVEGRLAGTALVPVRWSYVRWHAWVYFHRATRIFRSRIEAPLHRADCAHDLEPFAATLSALSDAGHEVRIGEPLVSQRRPRQASASHVVYVDGDRLVLHRFESSSAARDFHEFDASWSGYPIKPRSHESRTRRVGLVVIESDPEARYVDPANIVPRPDSVIRWAPVLESAVLDRLAAEARDQDEDRSGLGFLGIVRALRLAGCDVVDVAFLPPGQLRVGTENGIALTIDAEHFLVYRFHTEEGAAAYAATEPHGRASGRYVIRSTPDTMYEDHRAEVLYAGEEHIRWSRRLDDPAFLRAFERATGAAE